jgi:hypothetical protein
MNEKKAYPLRINAEILAAAQRWADDELRSLNAQIEYVLRDALRRSGRLKPPDDDAPPPVAASSSANATAVGNPSENEDAS